MAYAAELTPDSLDLVTGWGKAGRLTSEHDLPPALALLQLSDWPYPLPCFLLVSVSIAPPPQQHLKKPMPHCQHPPTCRMFQVRPVGAQGLAQLRTPQPKRAGFPRELRCPQSYQSLERAAPWLASCKQAIL